MERIAPGAQIEHHFCDGVYMKECHIEHGFQFPQHEHPFDHLSILARGQAAVTVDGKTEIYQAPKIITIKAGKIHTVTALSDIVWICSHRDDVTDPAKIDESILSGANRG